MFPMKVAARRGHPWQNHEGMSIVRRSQARADPWLVEDALLVCAAQATAGRCGGFLRERRGWPVTRLLARHGWRAQSLASTSELFSPRTCWNCFGPEVTSTVGWETAPDRFRRHGGKLLALGRSGAPI